MFTALPTIGHGLLSSTIQVLVRSVQSNPIQSGPVQSPSSANERKSGHENEGRPTRQGKAKKRKSQIPLFVGGPGQEYPHGGGWMGGAAVRAAFSCAI